MTYTCYLTNEDEKKVINYFNDNKDRFKELNNTTVRWIVNELYDNDEIEIYKNSKESDFYTNKIYVDDINY